jgi:hypothetical protein
MFFPFWLGAADFLVGFQVEKQAGWHCKWPRRGEIERGW